MIEWGIDNCAISVADRQALSTEEGQEHLVRDVLAFTGAKRADGAVSKVVTFAFSATPSDAIAVSIADPTTDDACIFMYLLEIIPDADTKSQIFELLMRLPEGILSDEEAAEKGITFAKAFEKIMNQQRGMANNGVKVEDLNDFAEEESEKECEVAKPQWLLLEYDSLDSILSDPYVNQRSAVIKYRGHYFAEGSNPEFAARRARCSQVVLNEYGQSLGEIAWIKTALG